MTYRTAPSRFRSTLCAALCALACVAPALQAEAAPLRVEAGRFVDQQGGDVVLRGFNLSQLHKVPNFRPNNDPQLFDKLTRLGVNAVRLQFNWEAFELQPGVYDESYLTYYAGVVERAAAKGVYVLVDVHQDAFSRWTLGGCGEGFPRWAIPAGIPQSTPDNGAKCANWGPQTLFFSRNEMERAFNAFMTPGNFARGRYMALLGRLAQRFAHAPNVIGYDLLNEPLGSAENLVKLYQDGAAVVRAAHPDAIVFVEPEMWTGIGLQATKLTNPGISNLAFAPHYYDPLIYFKAWTGLRYESVAARNRELAKTWGAAVLLGEFGSPPWMLAPNYMDMIYNDLERFGESGTQWTYTPEWNPTTQDGWNNENLSVIDDKGQLRNNFAVRPYVMRTAGAYGYWQKSAGVAWLGIPSTITYSWQHQPGRGTTDVFVPTSVLGGRAQPSISVLPSSVSCQWLAAQQVVRCTSDKSVAARLTVK
ncbi:MAG: cellulase family glycosylhydrolase [Aquabacterium sp.]|nr:cellulase family glycosylhydrolase [Aquabacterium sp.]